MLIFLIAFIKSYSQQLQGAPEKNIPLCCSLTTPDYEFSGLAKWRNFILLIPQHNTVNDIHNIIAVDTLSIDSVLRHQSAIASGYKVLAFDSSLNSVSNAIENTIGPHNKYGGFEAAAAIADTLFFTAETDSLCFVIKGVIKQQKKAYAVVFKVADTMSLPKPDYRFANAGFESIAYLPVTKKLIAFYENNNLTGAATAFTFTTGFKNKTAVHFAAPLPFRLTDVAATTDSAGAEALTGINYFYNDFKNDTTHRKTEFDYYLTDNTDKVYTSLQLGTAASQMHGGNLLKDCFSRIITMHIRGDTLTWQEQKMISYQPDNWEGIASYKKGVILIIDGKPPGVPCRLSYFSLSDN